MLNTCCTSVSVDFVMETINYRLLYLRGKMFIIACECVNFVPRMLPCCSERWHAETAAWRSSWTEGLLNGDKARRNCESSGNTIQDLNELQHAGRWASSENQYFLKSLFSRTRQISSISFYENITLD